MAHKHRLYGSFPPWGKSVEFPAGGGGGNYVYFDTLGVDGSDPIVRFASICKVVKNGITGFITPMRVILDNIDSGNILALGFDMSLKVTDDETLKLVSIGEVLDARGVDAPRITEEEFYDTNLGNEE